MPSRTIRIRYVDYESVTPFKTLKTELESKIIPRKGETVRWKNRKEVLTWQVMDISYIYQTASLVIEIMVRKID